MVDVPKTGRARAFAGPVALRIIQHRLSELSERMADLAGASNGRTAHNTPSLLLVESNEATRFQRLGATRPLMIRVSGALACRFGALLRRPQASANGPVWARRRCCRDDSRRLARNAPLAFRILDRPSKRTWEFLKL